MQHLKRPYGVGLSTRNDTEMQALQSESELGSDKRDASAPSTECEGQLLKLPPEGITYSSLEEMRRELVEFARLQGYGIRICRSFQKFSRVTGNPVAKKRLVWQCNRAGKGGCPFSFNAVEVKIGTDQWEIRYKKNESQHVHNHGPSDGPGVHSEEGKQI